MALFSTGAVARPPLGTDNIKARLQEEVLVGPRNPETLYVFDAVKFATSYLTKLEPGLRCYALGDYVACHDAAAGSENAPSLGAIDLKSYAPPGYGRLSLAAYLRRHAQKTIALVAQGGVGEVASGADNLLTAAGLQLGRLVLGEAYVAVPHKGDVVFEGGGEDEPPHQLWVAGNPIGGRGDTGAGRLVAPKNLRVFSEGTVGKQRAQLLVGGVPVGRLDRGLNVAVLDERFEVLSFATFNTFVTDEGVVKE